MGFQGPDRNDLITTHGIAGDQHWDAETGGPVVVTKVDARNDHGDQCWVTGVGRDANEAVQNAIDRLIDETGDDSWVMNDWRPA